MKPRETHRITVRFLIVGLQTSIPGQFLRIIPLLSGSALTPDKEATRNLSF